MRIIIRIDLEDRPEFISHKRVLLDDIEKWVHTQAKPGDDGVTSVSVSYDGEIKGSECREPQCDICREKAAQE